MPLATIIGVGPKIGYAVAQKFAEARFDLALASRGEEKLQYYKRILESENCVSVTVIPLDVTKRKKAREALQEVVRETDVLVYNTFFGGKSGPFDHKIIRESLETGILGAVNTVPLFLEEMAAKSYGKVFFTGGGFAEQPHPQYVGIGIDKAAVRNYALVLAAEYQPQGVHVGTLTINGKVEEGGILNPEMVAEAFFDMYSQEIGDWEHERQIGAPYLL